MFLKERPAHLSIIELGNDVNTLLVIFLDVFIFREHRVGFILNLNSFSICRWLVILAFDFNLK